MRPCVSPKKESLAKFRSELEKAIDQLKAAGKAETLIFFIDELDRCRPTFAIELLERVKHLFDVENIIFVLSIDKSQLEASTGAVYGERIDAKEYLRRFIDLEFNLPQIPSKDFTKVLVEKFELVDHFNERGKHEVLRADRSNFIDTFSALSDIFSLSLRTQEQCITRLAIVLHQTPTNHLLDPILLALLIILRLKNNTLLICLSNGTSTSDDAMSYLATLPGGREFVDSRLGIILECYLIAGDGDEGRESAKRRSLEAIANSQQDTIAGKRAASILNMRGHVPPQMFHRGSFDLKSVISKIDTATQITR